MPTPRPLSTSLVVALERAEMVHRLNVLCRSERAAVHTYEQALDTKCLRSIFGVLRQNRTCHLSRVALLCERIAALGGAPAMSKGVWGSFLSSFDGPALALGRSIAVAVLEEGEARVQRAYDAEGDAVDTTTQRPLLRRLRAAQEATQKAIVALHEPSPMAPRAIAKRGAPGLESTSLESAE